MISAEQNELMTRVGPQTPAGKLLRRYWQPVALVDELKVERPVRPVKVLGENFVLFKDDKGRYGLIDRHCAHRGADLAYGRLEDGGLRCSFHGWLYDVAGKCLETPAEPEGSRLCDHIRLRCCPVIEKSGALFAYLGAGEPPAFPHFDCFVAPDAYTFAFKGYWDCNWLQALEVGIDPAHASWLHKFFEDEDPATSYGRQFRGTPADSGMPISKVLREYDRPEIRRANALRHAAAHVAEDQQRAHAYSGHQRPFPAGLRHSHECGDDDLAVARAGRRHRLLLVRDLHELRRAGDKDTMRDQRLKTYPAPDYKPISNRSNSWGFDAGEQKKRTFTGMGFDINIHDQWACESQGPIQDRTKENLGATDKGIVLYRRLLLDAIRKNEAGQLDVNVEASGPPAIDGIGPTATIDEYWKQSDEARRRRSAWAA